MQIARCVLIADHVVGEFTNTISFVIPIKRFQKQYGYVPQQMTTGNVKSDRRLLPKIFSGQIPLKQLI